MASAERISIWSRLCNLRLLGRAAALGGVVVACLLLAAPLAFATCGVAGFVAALLAALICLVAGELGLLIASLFHGPAGAMNGALVGMQVRMAIPLGAGVGLYLLSPALADAGFAYYLLAFYLVGLAVETLLLLAMIPQSETKRVV